MRNPPVKLLGRVRQRIRLKGYSIRTEKTYVSWIRQVRTQIRDVLNLSTYFFLHTAKV